jgi:hypothetical protein
MPIRSAQPSALKPISAIPISVADDAVLANVMSMRKATPLQAHGRTVSRGKRTIDD